VGDALAFRRARYDRFPAAGDEERQLELNEGLAEYSGIALAAPDPAIRLELTRQRLMLLDSAPSFERDFAYHTGPAWGLLLDDLVPGWRSSLTSSDNLALLAGKALTSAARGVRPATARGTAYGIALIRKEEAARALARDTRLRGLRTRFVTGPRLELPLAEMKLGFDPGQVEAFEGGTVYGMLRLSDRWGVLQCDASGGYFSGDYTRVVIPSPADTAGRRLTGPGWILELLPGWKLVRGARPGDWTVVKE
jgi:hypothetical protein